MKSARLYEYNQPLKIEDVQMPKTLDGEQVLVKVGATGLCHSDLHIINGDLRNIIPIKLPLTLGHEIAGYVEQIGSFVPEGIIEKGDLVVIFSGWGCGVCIYCKRGDEQSCISAKWPGVMNDGGFSEYIIVPSYRFLLKIDKKFSIPVHELAPLADAGLTPYRAIKKVKDILGPGKSIGIIGIGGLGSYGIQYAKIFSSGASVIAFGRNNQKLELAQNFGADYIVNIKDKNLESIQREVNSITDNKRIDIILDCVGLEETSTIGINLLAKGGTFLVTGLLGNIIKIPTFLTVVNEFKISGSLWGNYNELREVIELAKKGMIKHHIQKFNLSNINEAIDLLNNGSIIGRSVIIP